MAKILRDILEGHKKIEALKKRKHHLDRAKHHEAWATATAPGIEVNAPGKKHQDSHLGRRHRQAADAAYRVALGEARVVKDPKRAAKRREAYRNKTAKPIKGPSIEARKQAILQNLYKDMGSHLSTIRGHLGSFHKALGDVKTASANLRNKLGLKECEEDKLKNYRAVKIKQTQEEIERRKANREANKDKYTIREDIEAILETFPDGPWGDWGRRRSVEKPELTGMFAAMARKNVLLGKDPPKIRTARVKGDKKNMGKTIGDKSYNKGKYLSALKRQRVGYKGPDKITRAKPPKAKKGKKKAPINELYGKGDVEGIYDYHINKADSNYANLKRMLKTPGQRTKKTLNAKANRLDYHQSQAGRANSLATVNALRKMRDSKGGDNLADLGDTMRKDMGKGMNKGPYGQNKRKAHRLAKFKTPEGKK